jgi:hypothetical protein
MKIFAFRKNFAYICNIIQKGQKIFNIYIMKMIVNIESNSYNSNEYENTQMDNSM